MKTKADEFVPRVGSNVLSLESWQKGKSKELNNLEFAPHVVKIPQKKSATRGEKRGRKPSIIQTWTIDAVQASAGTWAFRARTRIKDPATGKVSRPVYYLRYVTHDTYQRIRKGNYEGFKKLILTEFTRRRAAAV